MREAPRQADVDPHIAALDPEIRGRLATIWEERAKSELGAGSAYAIVVTELYELGAHPEVIELATRAAHDEVRHARLCRDIAEAYRGAPVSMPRPKRVGMPDHHGVKGPLLWHLHVLGLSCINETLAAAFVRCCLATSEVPMVHALQKQHLEDEIRHARVGWAHFGSDRVDQETKRALAEHAPRLVRANLNLWRRRIGELPEHGVPGHGYPPVAELIDTVETAMREVVVPGLRHVGIA